MHKREKIEYLRSNIKYLIESREETQISLCNASGLTRSTIYNILEGRVTKVQRSTIRKISDFFGVSYSEIETINLRGKEEVENSISLEGNMNPAAVPIIKQSQLLEKLHKRIGELSTTEPLTYYFGHSCNLIGVLIETRLDGLYISGDLLIVKKGSRTPDTQHLAYDMSNKQLTIVSDVSPYKGGIQLIGEIMEERLHD